MGGDPAQFRAGCRNDGSAGPAAIILIAGKGYTQRGLTDVTFVGRLATYKYLDMDDVVAQVMTKLA